MGLLDAPSLSKAQASATFAGRKQLTASSLRANFRDAGTAYLPPTVTPTFTLGAANGAATITGTLTTPLTKVSAGDAADNTDVGKPFTYIGGYDLAYGTSGIDLQQVRARLLTAATAAYGPFSVRFGFAGDTQFEIRFKMVAGLAYRLRIDDRWVSEAETTLTGTTGSVYYLKVSGLDAGPHIYQLDVVGSFWFGGIQAANTATLWKPPAPAVKAVLLGDSIAGGSGSGSGGSASMSVWWERTCDLLGWGRWNAGVGGTGMTAEGTSTHYEARLDTDVSSIRNLAGSAPFKPNIICVDGSRNDNAATLAAVQAAAASCYAKAKADNPNAIIITCGAWQSVGSPTQAYLDANTGLRQAALAASLPFVDYTTGKVYDAAGNILVDGTKWITGTGKQGTTTGTGNSDLFILSDGTHPTRAGHDYHARQSAQAFKAIIDSLAA